MCDVITALVGVPVDHVEVHTTVSSTFSTPTGLSINDHSRMQSLSFITLTVFHATVVIVSPLKMFPMPETRVAGVHQMRKSPSDQPLARKYTRLKV